MNIDKRKPSTPGDIMQEEFLEQAGLGQGQLADLIGVRR